MSLRKRVTRIIVVVLAVVFGLTFYFAVSGQRQSLTDAKQRELADVAKIVQTVLEYQKLMAAGSAEIIADQPWVAQAMRSGDRDALLKGTQPLFQRMKDVYGASVLQFFTPPATALLFVEDPAMPITDFRDTRQMVIAATVQETNQRGLELGPVGLAVRGIAPIRDAQGMAGVAEYAMDFQALLAQVSKLTETQLAVFINEDQWKRARKHDKEFVPLRDQVIEGKRAVYSTDWSTTSAIVTPDILAPTRGDRIVFRKLNGTEYGLLTMPLTDFSGEQIGYIVSIRSFHALNAAYVDAVRQAAIRVLLGFIISLGAVIIVFNSLLLRPVVDLLEKLRKVAKGSGHEPLDIAGRTDEVGQLFGLVEELRLKSATADAAQRKPS